MRRRLYPLAASCGALIALGGCVQATRHSNTMVFGTNTTFGVKVGANTGEVPEVVVGYDRQEAVIMPLVANTGSKENPNMLTPCDLKEAVTVQGESEFAIHPCSLVAVNGKALDSYSVLASFGAEYDAGGGQATGGLAQYFATGVAAQLLAATGGASVVATGPSAVASALNAPPVSETIESLYGETAAFRAGRTTASAFDVFLTKFKAKVDLTDTGLAEKVAAFETAAGSTIKISASCTDAALCKAAAKNAYAIGYLQNAEKFETAFAAWTIP